MAEEHVIPQHLFFFLFLGLSAASCNLGSELSRTHSDQSPQMDLNHLSPAYMHVLLLHIKG